MAYTHNQVWGQSRLHSKTLPQTKINVSSNYFFMGSYLQSQHLETEAGWLLGVHSQHWIILRHCLKENFLLEYISQWGPWLLPITLTLKNDWSWSSPDWKNKTSLSAGRTLGKYFLLLIVNTTGTKQVSLPQTCSYSNPENLLQLSYSLNDLGEGPALLS